VVLSPVVIGLGVGIAPNSDRAVREVSGSYAPITCLSLAPEQASEVTSGLSVRDTVAAEASDHTGRTTTYFWTATQHGRVISSGNRTLRSGKTIIFGVGTGRAKHGEMRIALNHTKVFVMVPLNGHRQ
jgi:hypothetical protein